MTSKLCVARFAGFERPELSEKFSAFLKNMVVINSGYAGFVNYRSAILHNPLLLANVYRGKNKTKHSSSLGCELHPKVQPNGTGARLAETRKLRDLS